MRILIVLLLVLWTSILYSADFTYLIKNNRNEFIELSLDKLKVEPSNIIKRIPGEVFWGPHGTCKMCLGNHLIQNHSISGSYMGYDLITSGYLNKIGYDQWQTLHDNLHNDPNFVEKINKPQVADITVFTPTPMTAVLDALEFAQVKREDIVYDLGCGDGRVVIAASSLYGCKSVGIDIDQDCARLATDNVKLNKLDNLVKIYCSDILDADISQATVIFLYVMPELSQKLVPKLKQLKPGTRIVMYDKPIPGMNFNKKNNIYLWTIPQTNKMEYL